ncbi:MAG: hypothetical protein IAB93_01720 [Bacteroidetes bacterium]|uniref:Uncharacterized protein n=1 Tax=Candidatus Merdivivens pullistercoris TaxID=2840873 RepID=A0A9D9I3Y8_9BACT|nr:hypothetical protein [Candidatus Merdivivens pullistercoris]
MGKCSFFDELIEALEAMDDAPVRRPYRNVVKHVEPQGNVAVSEVPHGDAAMHEGSHGNVAVSEEPHGDVAAPCGQASMRWDAGSNPASMHGDAVSASLENTSVPEVFPSAENGGHPNDSHSNDSRSGKKLIDDPKKLVIFSEIMRPKF